MADLKTYKCREKNLRIWHEIEGLNPLDAAEAFAEEECLADDDVVVVKDHGSYKIRVKMEWEAEKI
jgi:hypothetical protein